MLVDTNIETTPEDPDQPGIDEPTNPEIPDIDYPDISDPTEPVTPTPEDPNEPDNPPVEPDYPEVNPPEENQPSIDEQEKNIAYNAALLQLKNGYSYEAYYGFLELGDYRDSKELLEQALWLNRLSMNITMWNYGHLNNHNWSNYPNMTDEEIYNTLVNKTFYKPFSQSPQISATQFLENGILYNLGDNTTGYSKHEQGTWYVTNQHIIENSPTFYDQYDHRFIKITDGLYASIICDFLEHDILCDIFVFYFDASSPIGQGLRAFYDRYDYVNWTIQSRPDANGIYYLY